MTPPPSADSDGGADSGAAHSENPGAAGKSTAAGAAPRYKRYRARRLARGTSGATGTPFEASSAAGAARTWRRAPERARASLRGARDRGAPWLRASRERISIKRLLLGLLVLAAGWVALSVVLLLLSSHFERISAPANVKNVLDPGGLMLTSANNILVLGSDRRPKGSREPHANTSGPSNSDVMMVVRTGGGHAGRLSIPRDTVVEIPGHGLHKINAAYAFGGPALAISVVEHYLGVPINHVVEVNFENFPQLIDAMGGVTYTGNCVLSYLDGGSARGGLTLQLSAGTHHLDGKEALALARTRENHCGPEPPLPDLARDERQQALLGAMRNQLLSFSSALRLPLIAWNTPPAIISDMTGPELLMLFAALAVGGTPSTHVLEPSGTLTLPDGEVGLTVSEAERRAAVARLLKE
jgi:LCP family protein required for cell wall assembly